MSTVKLWSTFGCYYCFWDESCILIKIFLKKKVQKSSSADKVFCFDVCFCFDVTVVLILTCQSRLFFDNLLCVFKIRNDNEPIVLKFEV